MSNPFDNPDGNYMVLRNADGQYSLWPTSAAVPAGWRVVVPAARREVCVAYLDERWPELRPVGGGRTAAPTASPTSLDPTQTGHRS